MDQCEMLSYAESRTAANSRGFTPATTPGHLLPPCHMDVGAAPATLKTETKGYSGPWPVACGLL
jgi:hypothetical protein